MQCYCNVLHVIYEYMAEVTALVYVVAPFLMCMVKVIALMYDVKHSCDVYFLSYCACVRGTLLFVGDHCGGTGVWFMK